MKRSVRAKSDAVTLDGNAIPRALSSATNVTTHEGLIHVISSNAFLRSAGMVA